MALICEAGSRNSASLSPNVGGSGGEPFRYLCSENSGAPGEPPVRRCSAHAPADRPAHLPRPPRTRPPADVLVPGVPPLGVLQPGRARHARTRRSRPRTQPAEVPKMREPREVDGRHPAEARSTRPPGCDCPNPTRNPYGCSASRLRGKGRITPSRGSGPLNIWPSWGSVTH